MRMACPRRFRDGGTRSSGDAPWATVARSRLGVGEPLPRSQFSHRTRRSRRAGQACTGAVRLALGATHGLPFVYLPLLLLRVRPPAARGGRTSAGQLPARRFEWPCGPVHPRLELHGQRVPSRQALGADDPGIERPGARVVAGGGRGSRRPPRARGVAAALRGRAVGRKRRRPRGAAPGRGARRAALHHGPVGGRDGSSRAATGLRTRLRYSRSRGDRRRRSRSGCSARTSTSARRSGREWPRPGAAAARSCDSTCMRPGGAMVRGR